MQYCAKVMAMAFTALVCKLEQCDMVVCELILASSALCMCLGNCAEGFAL